MIKTEELTKRNTVQGQILEGQAETIDFGEFDENTAVDPRILYPSYKSFDEFVDIGRLRSLDGYITQRVKRRLQVQKDYKFYTGPYKLDDSNPDRPGSRMIYLACSEMPDSYFDLDKTELW
ncbi:MAG: hypothetical protein LC768_18480, partial [Acidobacteria bacterium]|nr:hypothetical protein [Acidobacteriota bacterium]